MKYLNIKRITAMFTAGLILINMSGCKKNEEQVRFSETSASQSDEFDENDNNEVMTSETKDEDIIRYFEELEKEIDSYINEENFDKVKEKAKNIIITGIDFIFYGKEIKGVTFDSLTSSAKEKIMTIVAMIDSKLESKIPNYKETIKDKFGQGYDYVSQVFDEALMYADGKLTEGYGEKYENFKDRTGEIIEDIKTGASDIYGFASAEVIDEFVKIKEWYEEKTNKE